MNREQLANHPVVEVASSIPLAIGRFVAGLAGLAVDYLALSVYRKMDKTAADLHLDEPDSPSNQLPLDNTLQTL